MRKGYLLTTMVALGVAAIIGWATLGTAQPGSNPMSGRPAAKPIIEAVQLEEPVRIPGPDSQPARPISKPKTPIDAPVILDPLESTKEPVRLLPEPTRFPDAPTKNSGPAIKIEDSASGPATLPDQGGRPEVNLASTQPSVALEWVGPGSVKVGAPGDYTLSVRNVSTIPVQKVIVQIKVPTGVNVLSAEPKAEVQENVLVWELGNLLSKQERRLTLKLVSAQRGDGACQAWVTFTGSSVIRMRVREPKLAVKLQAPDKVLVGDPANVVLLVSNPGDHLAEKVRVTAVLSDGLESIRGNTLNYDIGPLAPGETRTVTVPCATKSSGAQKCDVIAEAEGGLKASDSQAINVIQPQLDLALVGPKLRYLERKAIYTLKASNPGDAAATNVFLTHAVPNGFKFVQADAGGQFDDASRTIKWFVGELVPGQTKEVKCELLPITQGEFIHKVAAHASRGMKVEHDLKTAVEGLSAILMEVVDVEDPVEVGGETAYEIKITNTGSKAETDVKLTCTIPAQLKLKGIQAPVRYEIVGNEVVFATLPRLAPRADAVYKVVVTAAEKGDARFKASLTTASLVEPVIKVEPTKVYAD